VRKKWGEEEKEGERNRSGPPSALFLRMRIRPCHVGEEKKGRGGKKEKKERGKGGGENMYSLRQFAIHSSH